MPSLEDKREGTIVTAILLAISGLILVVIDALT